jgi:hypothetical protein
LLQAELGGDRRSEGFQEQDQVDNIKLKGGTQADYLRARLALVIFPDL